MKKVFMFVNVDWFFLSHRKSIAQASKTNNINMSVFCNFTKQHPDDNSYKFLKSPINRGTRNFLWIIFEFYKTYSLIKKEKPNLIHAVTVKPILLLGLIARITKTPFVGAISGLGPVFEPSGFKAIFRSKIVIIFYKIVFGGQAARAICQSNHDKQFLVKNHISSCQKINLIPGSGVNLDKFKPIHKETSERPLVLMASRILSNKGIIEFCKAASVVNEHFNDKVDFKLAGPIDKDSPSFITLDEVEKLCFKNKVDYLGNVKSINKLLASADLFVFPSYYPEGIPKVLLETSACGTAIITTNHPGCRDAIIEGKTGVLVEPRDYSALSDQIINLLNDSSKLIEMGLNGRKLAERSYCEKEVISEHYKIYKNLLQNTI